MTNAEQLALARQGAAVANKRKKEERLAGELRERGWTPLPPEARLSPLAAKLDHVISNVEHLCTGPDTEQCGPCLAEELRAHLRKIGALPTPVEHECCVCS